MVTDPEGSLVELLLLSNSTNYGREYLAHAHEEVRDFLSGLDELVFVPYALSAHDDYTARVQAAVRPLGVRVRGLHREQDPLAALSSARAVFIGGGNTFRLLHALQHDGSLQAVREAVRRGARYMGASAGTNIAAPTIRTTNDMPIVEPADFRALGLLPFQINPHFVDADPAARHMGETRETRLQEYLEDNDVPVLGLREGTWLRVTSDGAATIAGTAVDGSAPGPAVLFRRGRAAAEVSGSVSALLTAGPVAAV